MTDPVSDPDVLLGFIVANMRSWPALPSSIRYYDDFEDKYRSISSLASNDEWHIYHSGNKHICKFAWAPASLRLLLKYWCVWLFQQNKRPGTVATNFYRLKNSSIGKGDTTTLLKLIFGGPPEINKIWAVDILNQLKNKGEASSIKSMLRFLCEKRFGTWHPSFSQQISALPTPSLDLYKRIKSGDCFIPAYHQALFSEEIDNAVKWLLEKKQNQKQLDFSVNRYAILALCLQFGLRPGQIALISVNDVRCFETGAVHISFPIIKQRKSRSHTVRRVKREWGRLFSISRQTTEHHSDKLFDLKPSEVSRQIKDLTEEICGTPYSPGDFRHTASQRLVDAGASSISVAEFLEHSTLNAGTVYYDTSANQAELINQALSISPIYSRIAEVARTKTITKRALGEAPSDTIVAGMPHGIPVSGIGKCTVGQPNCQKHPVFSCYNCRHFLALKDEEIHKRTLTDFRQVAREFYNAERISEVSPAFLQLKDTIAAVQRTLQDIQEMDREG